MLKEIRIAKEKDCPKLLELLEYICNLHRTTGHISNRIRR